MSRKPKKLGGYAGNVPNVPAQITENLAATFSLLKQLETEDPLIALDATREILGAAKSRFPRPCRERK